MRRALEIKNTILRRYGDFLASELWDSRSAGLSQLALMESYRQRSLAGSQPPAFRDTGFGLYSQHEEDGLLLYLFSLLGMTNKVLVEICAGDGIECNSANLLLHHRWTGALFDGSEANIAKGRAFYARQRSTLYWPPTMVSAWITRDNVNQLILDAGVSGDIDLLSLDIDGVDYWVWEALEAVRPRVVVLEFNHLWGPTEAVTVPYTADFVAAFSDYGSDYAGASIAAFVALGKRKGYRLVGTNAYATNAFFVDEALDHAWLPEISPTACFEHPRARFGMTSRLPAVRDREWIRL